MAFPVVLNMSITASAVILCVLLARLLLRRAPKLFSYALWAVVLFRLLCPVSVSSALSLMGVFRMPAAETGQMEYLPISADGVAGTPALPESEAAAKAEVPQAAAQGAPALLTAAGWVWLGGMAVLLIYNLVQLLRLRRRLVGAAKLRDNVYLSDHADTPFVLGLLRPKIYLPSSLSGSERVYIIEHEQHHIRRGDPWIRLLAFAALCIHWFNPLVWVAFTLSGRDMEMSCDEAVMKRMGPEIRAAYSSSLLRLSVGKHPKPGTPLAFGEGDPKRRIRNIMNYRKPALWAVAGAVILCIGLTACLGVNPEKATEAAEPLSDASPFSAEGTKAADVAVSEPASLQTQLTNYIAALHDQAYQSYYEDLHYEITDYHEVLNGKQFTATFLWTMYFRDTGADVLADRGTEAAANYNLQATGTLSDGVISSVEVMVGVGATGPIEYTQPLETYFPGTGSVLILHGYIADLDPAARRLEFDQVSYLTDTDNAEVLQELGVDPNTLPNGYYLYNPEEAFVAYDIAAEAVCWILDSKQELLETDLDTLAQGLNTRTPLYVITVENGIVTELSEHYLP